MDYDDEDIFETGEYEEGEREEQEPELEDEEDEEQPKVAKPENKRVKLTRHVTQPRLNHFELTRIISERANEIANGADLVVPESEVAILRNKNPYIIAQIEMRRALDVLKKRNKNNPQSEINVMNNPYVKEFLFFPIERELGSGLYEEWSITDFTIF
jgi:DNA-directed RNA polymerase subunit K/omega